MSKSIGTSQKNAENPKKLKAREDLPTPRLPSVMLKIRKTEISKTFHTLV